MGEANYIWELQKIDDLVAESLKKELDISIELARVLSLRGVKDFDSARNYFRPKWNQLNDGFLMKGMNNSVDRVYQAIINSHNILIYGDYDVDGTCSVSMMTNFLRSVTKNIFLYQPDRESEGYGISLKSVKWMEENKIDLVIALDCGIKDIESSKAIKKLNIDLIICDHHNPGVSLPDAFSILNPKQNGCNYPFKDLCGCGVGFKLIQCLVKKYNLEVDYSFLVQLVAIATAADIVPLVNENRILAYLGLREINKNPIPALKEIFQITNKKGDVSISDLVFKIAPRINAAGRLSSAIKAAKFLTSSNSSCTKLVTEIEIINQKRRLLDQEITSEALSKLKDRNKNHATNLIYSPNWHKGVVGIVASRIIEKYYKPTIVLTGKGDILTGSARSVKGFDIYSVLEKLNHYFISFGGHKYAAGITLKKENLKPFFKCFETEVKNSIVDECKNPKIKIDSELSIDSLAFDSKNKSFPKTYRIIKQMEPFGPLNPRPIFLFRNLIFANKPKIVGENHIKFNFTDKNISTTIEGIWFNSLSRFEKIKNCKSIDVLASLTENNFRDQLTMQLLVSDLRVVD